MKKISVLLAVLLVGAFFLMALGSGNSETTDQGSGNAAAQGESNKVGDYSVEIVSCRLAKDYEGKPVAIVKYNFKNISDDDSGAFSWKCEDTVYQNGVGLNESYVVEESANYDSANQTKEIKKGASVEVEVAYVLNDTTTDLEVEVKALFSFTDNNVLKKTFKIAE